MRVDILGIMQRMFLLGQGPRVGMGVGGYIEFKNQIKKKKNETKNESCVDMGIPLRGFWWKTELCANNSSMNFVSK